ncbi:DNA polymerase PolB2 inactivated [Methanonatronarchaeum thermophilum]|uniref:DNA-directed DNA polymerase n=2 Tax=Methanonatronarchaeum thermophilum TaxID=1927129 RepID=A0A1Y3GD34_9EURY|nr:DNA polymerase PolB2 inactivated [Methanonatronarchaeum thermophilum]
MILFDISVDKNQNIELWFKSKNRIHKKCIEFYPKFYFKSNNTKKAFNKLSSYDVDTRVVEKRGWPGQKTSDFIEVIVKNPRKLHKISRELYQNGGYKEHTLYNVDLSIPFRYLLQNGLYPTLDLKRHDRWNLDYVNPDLKTVEIDIKTANGSLNDKSLKSLELDGSEFKGSEQEKIDSLVKEIRKQDPDIIYTDDGVLNYLKERAEKDIHFGRLPGDKEIGGDTYRSYGQTIYKPMSLYMRGRIQINKNSFIYGESGLDGVLELSRLSSRPIHEVCRASPGTVISSMQIAKAFESNILIPWKKSVPEDFKSARKLIKADRGGLTLQPITGFHSDVVEVDYSSLFPNIILKKNISPETINCSCNHGNKKIPQLDYTVCNKKGFLPKVIEPVILRRKQLKKRTKNGGCLRDRRRVVALKWILVTCFGYTGYKNAKYGKIECHESICAYGRDILVKTSHIAQKHGFKVIHGVVDSLWLSGDGDINKFKKQVNEEIGIPIEIEDKYKWMVFLPKLDSKTGALNKYYGVKQNEELKTRGIETRRHDTPKIIKKFQKEVLEILKKANTEKEYKQKQIEALEVLEKYKNKLKNKSIPREKLAYTSKPSKKIKNYKTMNRNKAALIKHKEKNIDKKPGEKIKYIIRNSKLKNRDKIALINQKTPIDTKHYIKQLERAYKTLQPKQKNTQTKNQQTQLTKQKTKPNQTKTKKLDKNPNR